MNNQELVKKVHSAMYTLIKEKGVASPAEVLIAIGVLAKEKYADWRFGRVPYLEKVCQINLSKLSTINHEIRVFARKNNLKASWSDYRKWDKGNRTRLRFSKGGGEQIERLYATHYIAQQKVSEAAERHDFQKRKNKLAQTIAPCGLICGLCGEAPDCKGCREDGCARAVDCYQRKCCVEKDIKGCWKCTDFPCSKGMFSPERDARLTAFVRCAKEDGPKALAGYVLRNQDDGIFYHRDKQKHTGDYDNHGSKDAVLKLLCEGKNQK
jgi:hypothetical protein